MVDMMVSLSAMVLDYFVNMLVVELDYLVKMLDYWWVLAWDCL